jgi:hypothetical protein
MNKEQRARREASGWRYGSATDFLVLTSEDATSVERKLAKNRARRTTQDSPVASEKGLPPSKKERNH